MTGAVPTRSGSRLVVVRDLAIVGVLALSLIVFTIGHGPGFLSLRNLSNILDAAALVAIFAVGEAVVIMAGAIDLSIAAIAAASGVLAGRLLVEGLPSALVLLIALLFGALLGLVNGLLVTALRLTPLVATLASLSVFSGLAFILADGRQIFGVVEFGWLGQQRLWNSITVPTVVMIVLVAAVAIFMSQTRWGLRLLAVGGNLEAARRSGIRVTAYTNGAFVFSGATSALAGCITLGFLTTAEPAAATTVIFQAITAVALGGVALSGGRGSILRVAIGAVVLSVIATGLLVMAVPPYYALVITGVLLVLAVLLEAGLTRVARTASEVS